MINVTIWQNAVWMGGIDMMISEDVLEQKKANKLNPVLYIQTRLKDINHGTLLSNRDLAVKLTVKTGIVGLLYAMYCYYFFHGVWYLNMLIVITTLIFMVVYLDGQLEKVYTKTLEEIPKTIRKLRYYLVHTQNIHKALESTEAKAPPVTKVYISRLRHAVESNDVKESMDQLKNDINEEWLKMICDLVYYCKINGDEDGIVTSNLAKVTDIIEFVNIQQGQDNVSLKGSQNFVTFAPLLGIPAIKAFNGVLYTALDNPQLVNSLTAQIMAAVILLFANVATLFILWIRKSA